MLRWVFFKQTSYEQALRFQEKIQAAVMSDPAAELFILTEHSRVFTLGKHARPEHILMTGSTLAQLGFEVHQIERGGDVTYHGPGQLVGYPILHMERHHFKVKEYVARLEEVLIQTLAGYGISAGRKTAYPGVWVGEQKIGMVGIQIKQHVTMHGFSLNVQPCLQDFGYIIPCGIANCQITSMAELLGGSAPTLTTLIPQLLRQFALIFEMSLVEISSEAANPDQELARELRPNSSTGE